MASGRPSVARILPRTGRSTCRCSTGRKSPMTRESTVKVVWIFTIHTRIRMPSTMKTKDRKNMTT